MKSTLGQGDAVTLHYRLSTPGGEVIDSSFGGEPLTLRIGAGELAANLEKRLIGLAPGRRTTFPLPPEEAFGHSDPAQVQTLAESQFPPGMALREHALIEFALPNGDRVSGVVVGREPGRVIVDFNHPLSDCAIVFEVEILSGGP